MLKLILLLTSVLYCLIYIIITLQIPDVWNYPKLSLAMRYSYLFSPILVAGVSIILSFFKEVEASKVFFAVFLSPVINLVLFVFLAVREGY